MGWRRPSFLYAYRSVQSDDLFILVEVHSDAEAVNIAGGEATYPRRSGAGGCGRPDLRRRSAARDSDATVAVVFDGAEAGGVLTVPVYSGDFGTEESLELETHAYS